MMEEVHFALIVDDVTADDVTGSNRSLSSSTTNSTAKKTKLDMLLTKIRPLMGVSFIFGSSLSTFVYKTET
jgi:hypothetical protein